MTQLILQSFRCFTYVTAHSPTLLSLLLCNRIFTYVTWRTTHALYNIIPVMGRGEAGAHHIDFDSMPVANSPIHRVYRRYTKFRRTKNCRHEMSFFVKKKSIMILNISPINQLRNSYHISVDGCLSQFYAVNARNARTTFITAKKTYIHAPYVLH